VTQTLLRGGDTLARFGGEEFIIIAPNTDEEGAYSLAERIRSGVGSYSFKYEDQTIPVTVSAGVVILNKMSYDLDQIKDKLTKEADEALYSAKNNGRNRVEIYKEN
jgi:diguanylate cyclase